MTVDPVLPAIAPFVAWSELATAMDVQLLGEHVIAGDQVPEASQEVMPEPEYPVWQMTTASSP